MPKPNSQNHQSWNATHRLFGKRRPKTQKPQPQIQNKLVRSFKFFDLSF